MNITPLRIIALVVGLFLAITVLGGSLIWHVLGIAGNQLTIRGAAVAVRPPPPGAGQGWGAYGGDAGGNRYSAADQITSENVGDLEIAWTYQTGAFEGRENLRGRAAFQTTPILVEDTLVFCTQFNDIIAIDPGDGAERWRYDAEVPTDGRPGNQFTCRGVAYWSDSDAPPGAACASRIYMGTVDARLIAVDAKTGAPCNAFGDNGAVRIKPSVTLRWPGEFQLTSAPVIVGDIVVTGSSIGDNLRTDAPLGTVHAFDARTGATAWSFDPVPRDPADPARGSWSDGSVDNTGHANVWAPIAVDDVRGLVFLPTSSPSPDYYGGNRIGDNHYANSVVALNGQTGDIVWHYQIVHHDVWDYDLPSQPGLYQVWRDGAAHDVVVQVTKMGLVFVLDRDTGEPFLPVEERAVPQGAVAGEILSPTQPFPLKPAPLVPNRFAPKDAFGITLWDKMACAANFRSLRREGLYTPPTLEGTLAFPFTGGGANWGSAAFDPTRNLLVVNMSNIAQGFKLHLDANDRSEVMEIDHDAEFAPMEGAPYGMSRFIMLSPLGLPCSPPPWGVIAGVDLASGDIVWRRTLGTTRDLAPGGLAFKLGTPNLGGPIITAGGVVFIGAAMDDYLRAFDVETGAELWKGRLPAGGQATPMTYEWQGRQYVVIAAGGHARAETRIGDHVVAFALPQ